MNGAEQLKHKSRMDAVEAVVLRITQAGAQRIKNLEERAKNADAWQIGEERERRRADTEEKRRRETGIEALQLAHEAFMLQGFGARLYWLLFGVKRPRSVPETFTQEKAP